MTTRVAALLVAGWVVLVGVLIGVGLLLPDAGVPHLDRPVLEGVREHRTPWLVSTMRVITTVGSPGWVLTAVALVAVVLVARRRVRDVVVLLACAFGADAGEQVVKAAVRRTRPPVALRVADISAHGLSFPSGHATVAAGGCGALAVLAAASMRRALARGTVLALGVIAAALVGLSRIYLGVHWPTDVVGGWLLSVVWLGMVTCAVAAPSRR